MDLAEFLERELRQHSYRDIEARTGVSRGSIEKIVKRRSKELPKIETLRGIAEGYNLPLWQVVEMAGVNLGLPRTAGERAQRLGVLAQDTPQLALIVEHLLTLAPNDPSFVDGMLIYLEAAAHHRATRG